MDVASVRCQSRRDAGWGVRYLRLGFGTRSGLELERWTWSAKRHSLKHEETEEGNQQRRQGGVTSEVGRKPGKCVTLETK